jgi:biotin transport system substrate-specific component
VTSTTYPTIFDAVPLPRTRWRTAVGVVGFALLTAVAAQVRFHLPFTPVPLTGQTFAVLLTGAALGMRAGAASQALYLVLGLIGLPVYTDFEGGWHAATGSTGGYLVGFVVAAAIVGALAERRQDRSFLTSVPAMLTGTAVIYTFGALWLAHHLGVSVSKAVELGVSPFLIGDAVKLVLAGLLLPMAWHMVGDEG